MMWDRNMSLNLFTSLFLESFTFGIGSIFMSCSWSLCIWINGAVREVGSVASALKTSKIKFEQSNQSKKLHKKWNTDNSRICNFFQGWIKCCLFGIFMPNNFLAQRDLVDSFTTQRDWTDRFIIFYWWQTVLEQLRVGLLFLIKPTCGQVLSE